MFKVMDTVADEAAAEPRPRRYRSRRNIWRDGLAAHSVIAGLEDTRSYRAFERAFISNAEPNSAIEHELILRLASLFWRLRRASAIETALLQRHGVDEGEQSGIQTHQETIATAGPGLSRKGRHRALIGIIETTLDAQRPLPASSDGSRAHKIAKLFCRMANAELDPFERVGAYEARLWRQAAQSIWMLDALRHPPRLRPGGRRGNLRHLSFGIAGDK